MSIYGSSKEDQWFLGLLNDHLDGGNMEVNESKEFEDFQLLIGDVAISVDGCAQIIDSNLVNVFIDTVKSWDDEGQEWVDTVFDYELVEEAIKDDETFLDYIGLEF